MSVHRIRLAGPWEWLPAIFPDSGSTERPQAGRQACQLPFVPAAQPDRPDAVRMYRRFHQPTGMDAATKITLLIQFRGVAADVQLNGISLPIIASVQEQLTENQLTRCDISGLLKAFNEVCIQISGSGDRGPAVLISVNLEIHE